MEEIKNKILAEYFNKELYPYNFKDRTNMKKVLMDRFDLLESQIRFWVERIHDENFWTLVISDKEGNNEISFDLFCDIGECRIKK